MNPTHIIITWDDQADIVLYGLDYLKAYFAETNFLDHHPESEDMKELTQAWAENLERMDSFEPWEACGYNFVTTKLPNQHSDHLARAAHPAEEARNFYLGPDHRATPPNIAKPLTPKETITALEREVRNNPPPADQKTEPGRPTPPNFDPDV